MTAADVVIAGGGFAGLASAAACAARGLRVVVLEARAGPVPAFRGELLHPPALRALARLGVEAALRAAGAARIAGFAAFGPRSELAVVLPYPSGEGLALGHEALLSALRQGLLPLSNVQVLRGSAVVDVLREKGRVVGLRTRDGQNHAAQVVVAADGRHSTLRGLLGIEDRARLLSYTIALGAEGSWLPQPDHGHVFLGAPGPILAYPYAAGRTRLCIDVPLNAPRGRRALGDYVARDFLPHLPDALRKAARSAIGPRSIELCANHTMYTNRCVVRGAALVGDAAGCSHPLTATGMTTALHDAELLAASLCERGPIDDRLRVYQRGRYRFARARELFAQALYEVFRADSPGARALCEGVFRYWRAGERSRIASMQILTGEESSTLRFLLEYARVVLPAGAGVCGAALRSGRLDALGAVRSLLSTLGTGLHAVLAQGTAALQRELSRGDLV
jgi:squalene monooxygenase